MVLLDISASIYNQGMHQLQRVVAFSPPACVSTVITWAHKCTWKLYLWTIFGSTIVQARCFNSQLIQCALELNTIRENAGAHAPTSHIKKLVQNHTATWDWGTGCLLPCVNRRHSRHIINTLLHWRNKRLDRICKAMPNSQPRLQPCIRHCKFATLSRNSIGSNQLHYREKFPIRPKRDEFKKCFSNKALKWLPRASHEVSSLGHPLRHAHLSRTNGAATCLLGICTF